jgi:tetratricopeptide (TPR) repeat protein
MASRKSCRSRAQDLIYDGWELFDSDLAEAGKCFRDAISLDPELADAYNGLAEVAVAKGHLAVAERHYLTAYEKAKASLGTEDKNAFAWWGELETRPYMRSRKGLALLYLEMERFDQAAALLKDLLRRNRNDNQGARYLVAPACLLKGDLAGALGEYDWYKSHYPGDIPDPHYLLTCGLALFLGGRMEEAATVLRSALYANPYLIPLVLAKKAKKLPIWHSNNLMSLDYAREYFPEYGRVWTGQEAAIRFVAFIWKDEEIERDFREWVSLETDLKGLEVSAVRTALVDRICRLEMKKLSPGFFLRMEEFLFRPIRTS